MGENEFTTKTLSFGAIKLKGVYTRMFLTLEICLIAPLSLEDMKLVLEITLIILEIALVLQELDKD